MPRLIVCSVLCALLSAHAPAASTAAEPDMRRPLDWLVAAQNDDGSWGDGARDLRPDVATTALAGLALARLGPTGSPGPYPGNTRRAGAHLAGAVWSTPPDPKPRHPPG